MSAHKPRNFTPLWADKWLNGSINLETKESKGFWSDILALGCKGQPPGTICKCPGQPYTHFLLSALLNMTELDFERLLNRHKEQGRILEDEAGIHIINWKKYQLKHADDAEVDPIPGNGHSEKPIPPDNPDKYTRGPYGHLVHH